MTDAEREMFSKEIAWVRESFIKIIEQQILVLEDIDRVPGTIKRLVQQGQKIMRRIHNTHDDDFAYSVWLAFQLREFALRNAKDDPSRPRIFFENSQTQWSMERLYAFAQKEENYPLYKICREIGEFKSAVYQIVRRWKRNEEGTDYVLPPPPPMPTMATLMSHIITI